MYRDNTGVSRRAKSDDRDIEQDRHTGGDARDRLTGIAVTETA